MREKVGERERTAEVLSYITITCSSGPAQKIFLFCV